MPERAVADSRPADRVAGAASRSADEAHPDQLGSGRWLAVASGAGALAFCLIIYLLRFDHIVGQAWDDAWYVLLAKALATHQGYTLINSPVSGIVPSLYPPAFPWLLSLVYRLGPEFPQNIWLLKSVSIAAMLGAGGVSYSYFRRERALPAYLAASIALATTLSPALVFLATSTVMSDCVFTFAQLLTIAVIERGVRPGQGNRMWWYVAGGALAAFTFLTRSISIALLVGAVLYLLLKRQVRGALVFAITVALAVGPWVLYSRLHASSVEQTCQGTILRNYTTLFWRRVGDDSSAGTISAAEIPGRLWHNTLDILGTRMAIVLIPTTPHLFKQGNDLPARQTNALSLALSALALAGFILAIREKLTLAEIVVPLTLAGAASWPWDLTRFLVPLTPFLIFYCIVGCRVVGGTGRGEGHSWATRVQRTVSGALAGSLLLLSVYENVSYIRREHSRPPAEQSQWVRRFKEHQRMYQWIRRHVPADAVIAAQNQAQVYLFTGRKTIASERATENWETWNRLNVRYVARTSFYPIRGFDWTDLNSRTVYRSRGELRLRVLDLGPASSRGPLATDPPNQ